MDKQRGPLKSIVASYEQIESRSQLSLRSWSSWFAGTTPQEYKAETNFPCQLFVNYQEITRGRWELSINSIHLQAKQDIDSTFQVSCNQVQHEAWTELKQTVVVPQPLELFTIKLRASERVEIRFSSHFFTINNCAQKLLVYIDQLGSSQSKTFEDLFSSMHVLVFYQKTA